MVGRLSPGADVPPSRPAESSPEQKSARAGCGSSSRAPKPSPVQSGSSSFSLGGLERAAEEIAILNGDTIEDVKELADRLRLTITDVP